MLIQYISLYECHTKSDTQEKRHVLFSCPRPVAITATQRLSLHRVYIMTTSMLGLSTKSYQGTYRSTHATGLLLRSVALGDRSVVADPENLLLRWKCIAGSLKSQSAPMVSVGSYKAISRKLLNMVISLTSQEYRRIGDPAQYRTCRDIGISHRFPAPWQSCSVGHSYHARGRMAPCGISSTHRNTREHVA